MKKGIISAGIATILLSFGLVQAQVKTLYPNVGEAFADHKFYDVINLPTKQINISDFKGKWLILDMWGYSCSACLASFPKMNKLSKQFKDNVQIVMVGATKARGDKTPVQQIEKITRNTYDRLNRTFHLEVPVAFDSVLYLKHDVGALPQIFIIDPNGILRAKTISIDSMQITELLKGRYPTFERSYSYSEKTESDSYNLSIPFLTTGEESNGGVDTNFLYRSLISPGTNRTPTTVVNLLRQWKGIPNTSGRVEIFNCQLSELYQLAFFGMNYWDSFDTLAHNNFSKDVIWQTEDSTLYNNQKKFTYSLTVPKSKSTSKYLMSIIQSDLHNYFGYNVNIENREMPVYSLVVDNRKKLMKLFNKKIIDLPEETKRSKLTFKNERFDAIVKRIEGILHLDKPLIDNTGILENVSFQLDANTFDSNGLKNRLHENGLRIIKAQKKMKVIVIRDSEPVTR